MFDDAVFKQPCGRPSRYSDEIVDTICERLANGESLRSICRNDNMLGQTTIFRWLGENDKFRAQHMYAREAQAEGYVDELISIADSVSGCTDNAIMNAARLTIDTRKWTAPKLLPRKYSDKLDVQQDGQLTVWIVTGLGEEPDKEGV